MAKESGKNGHVQNKGKRADPEGQIPSVQIPSVQISVPLVDTGNSAIRHVEIALDTPQSLALRRLFDGLQKGAKQLRNGMFINRQGEALKWLLEQFEAGSGNGKETAKETG